MTPEGQMCRDMLGELETQWERAGPLVKLQGEAIIPNLLMLVDTILERLDQYDALILAHAAEVARATAGQGESLADLEARHG